MKKTVRFYNVNFDGEAFYGTIEYKGNHIKFFISKSEGSLEDSENPINMEDILYLAKLVDMFYVPFIDHTIEKSGIKVGFNFNEDAEDTYKYISNNLVIKTKINCACTINGKPIKFSKLRQDTQNEIVRLHSNGVVEGEMKEQYNSLKEVMDQYHMDGENALRFIGVRRFEYSNVSLTEETIE